MMRGSETTNTRFGSEGKFVSLPVAVGGGRGFAWKHIISVQKPVYRCIFIIEPLENRFIVEGLVGGFCNVLPMLYK